LRRDSHCDPNIGGHEVLLYELLAGVLPFDEDTFRRAGLDEMRRTIREAEAHRPSTRATEIGSAIARESRSLGWQKMPRNCDWLEAMSESFGR